MVEETWRQGLVYGIHFYAGSGVNLRKEYQNLPLVLVDLQMPGQCKMMIHLADIKALLRNF